MASSFCTYIPDRDCIVEWMCKSATGIKSDTSGSAQPTSAPKLYSQAEAEDIEAKKREF
jgi:hypothetical protein